MLWGWKVAHPSSVPLTPLLPTPALVDSLKALIKFGEIHIFAVTFLYVTDGLEKGGLLPTNGKGGPCPRWVPEDSGVQMLARVLPAWVRTVGNSNKV